MPDKPTMKDKFIALLRGSTLVSTPESRRSICLLTEVGDVSYIFGTDDSAFSVLLVGTLIQKQKTASLCRLLAALKGAYEGPAQQSILNEIDTELGCPE